jgi:hypothetical protein
MSAISKTFTKVLCVILLSAPMYSAAQAATALGKNSSLLEPVGYAVGFALKLVIAAEALIERGDFGVVKPPGPPVHGV